MLEHSLSLSLCFDEYIQFVKAAITYDEFGSVSNWCHQFWKWYYVRKNYNFSL